MAVPPIFKKLGPWPQFVAAVALSYAVLFSTLLVTVHNLGARDEISYINGGKVFRQTGTMWYHLPGLQEVGLAPQNIGAQINLRNNEFAMLDRELRQVSSIGVDFALDEGALLLIILDRHREGTFRAVRLTAFPDEKSPFVNAVLRYEKGRVVERIPLEGLGRTLSAGKHSANVSLTDDGKLVVTVDDTSASIPFAVDEIRPNLALACGERNTTIFRWTVTGLDEDGRALEWVEEFSMMRSLDRHKLTLVLLAAFLWLLLLGGPLLKVALESGVRPIEPAIEALLSPAPRLIFGLVCVVPLFPMVVQWILGGLYVTYAWITLWERLAQSRRAWVVPDEEGSAGHVRWLIAACVFIAVAGALFGARSALRNSPVGEQADPKGSPALAGVEGQTPLGLGERVELALPDNVGGNGGLKSATVRARITLAKDEVARLDVLRLPPPITSDVYQVDRSQDPGAEVDDSDRQGPEGQPPADGGQGSDGQGSDGQGPDGQDDQQMGPSEYKFVSASAVISANAQMPGQLRLLESDKLERSPHVGWSVAPGEHELTVTVVPPLAWATVDGVIVDIRSDVPLDFVTGAAQVMCVTDSVAGVGRLSVETIHEETAAALSSTFWWADLLGVPALILLVIGLSLLLVAATRVTFSKRALWRAARKGLRAHTLVLVWLGFWAAGRLWGFKWGDEPGQVALGAIATTFSVINLAQVFRQSDAAAGIGRRAMAFVVLLVIFVGGVEGVGQLQPEWRHRWTTAWNHQLGPQFYYVQDPMIRRLNPWFIDQRFKRRDFAPRHPDTTRVVVFGGSQTYGWGIPAMDRMAFSDQLERSLHDRGHTDLEVLNAAFPGVKTSTGLRWFASNLLRYDPDIVVINFVVNEFMNVDQFHVWSGEQPKDASLASTIVGAMPERWRGNIMGNHLSQIIVADVYEIFAMEQCLRWWVDIARERGIEVVFSIEPTNLYVESGGDSIMREETSLGNAQEVYRRLGKELSVPVYDVLPHFVAEHENLWFYDTMHMSRLGHKVFAENLAALIESELLEQ